jgi:hypothetical protein
MRGRTGGAQSIGCELEGHGLHPSLRDASGQRMLKSVVETVARDEVCMKIGKGKASQGLFLLKNWM